MVLGGVPETSEKGMAPILVHIPFRQKISVSDTSQKDLKCLSDTKMKENVRKLRVVKIPAWI